MAPGFSIFLHLKLKREDLVEEPERISSLDGDTGHYHSEVDWVQLARNWINSLSFTGYRPRISG